MEQSLAKVIRSMAPLIAAILSLPMPILKLTGVINWPWLWVLCPVWIPLAFVTALITLLFMAVALEGM